MKLGRFDLRGNKYRLVWKDWVDENGTKRRTAIGVTEIPEDDEI